MSFRWTRNSHRVVDDRVSNMADFSIVIPFRHGAEYAWPALFSCRLASRRFSSEIIICLDRPSDDQRSLLEAQIKRAGVVVNLIVNTGAGISSAMNSAIDASTSELIVRHDIDDIMMPRRLQFCMELFDAGAEFAFGSALRFPKVKRISVPDSLWSARQRALHECPFIHPGSAFLKNSLKEVGGYDPYFDGVEDFDLWSRVLWSDHIIKTDQRLHVLYRRHRKQFTRTRDAHYTNLRRIEIFERNRISTLRDE